MFRDLGNRAVLAAVLTHLGDQLAGAGQPGQARDAWREALAIFDDLRDPAAGPVRSRLAGAAPAAV